MLANSQWGVFLQDPGGGEHRTYGEWLLTAWGYTVSISVLSLIIALIAGIAVGALRTLPSRPVVTRLAAAWVEVFRNTPLLLQIFLWYHVLPDIFQWLKNISGFTLVVIALGLFTSARIAEQVRSSIEALPRGQRHAGMALGLTTLQYYRHVLLPAALRMVIAPLTSEAMNIFKNSAVAFAVSVPELTMFAMQAQEETSRGFQIYFAVSILYMTSALAINRVMKIVERRLLVSGIRMPTLKG